MWLTKKKSSPYFQARWDHPDGSGKVLSASTREVAKRAAEARGLELEAAFREQWLKDQRGGNVSSRTVIEEYWQTEAAKLKSAVGHIFPHIARITTFLGEKPYCDVTIADVARFVDDLDGKVSDSTINRALSVWRRMHNVAGKKRLYPVKMIDWGSVRRLEPDYGARNISKDVLSEIIKHLPVPAQEIVAFDLATGARKSQVLTLTWERVDMTARTATIWRKHRKQNAAHVIPLSDTAMAVLERRRQAAPHADRSELVFDVTNFRKRWETAVRAAGAKGVRFHDLRHTVGYELGKVASAAVVQSLLGHSGLAVTQRYLKAQRDDVRAGVAQLPTLPIQPTGTESDT